MSNGDELNDLTALVEQAVRKQGAHIRTDAQRHPVSGQWETMVTATGCDGNTYEIVIGKAN